MIKAICALMLLLAGTQLVQAQFVQSRRNVDAGKATVIYSFFNCQTDVIQAVSGTASHGSIRTREVTQYRCGNLTQRAVVVDYIPHPGYRGTDEAYLYWGGNAQSRVHLNVR
ncbi:hypothetical protein [Bosea sp. 685]|uniref:hypothetical protein n=1 Tax=Bosea sp. 685 TaxID=3080057 RepID=UPI00289361C7|nr:hypothetical protein [Bosea sp. 685]WNJ91728.1 hypothetical protein RMR04_05310 [Bosea sp. 685]